MVPTLSYSDTEDDDVSSEDGCAQAPHQSSNDLKEMIDDLPKAEDEEPTCAVKVGASLVDEGTSIPSELPESTQIDEKNELSAMNDGVVVPKNENVAIPTKVASRSLRKRKKRDERVLAVPAKASRRANKSRAKMVCDPEYPAQQLEWADEEPLPAVVCFGIAAAAGTLAAMLCVYLSKL